MKRLALPLFLLLSALAAPAAILYEWPSDVDRPVPAVFEPFEGETVELACRVVRNRRDFPLYATNAVCYYQTNGMGRSYWSVPATVDGSLLRASLAPSDVPAAPVVYASIGAFGPSGVVYRANAILRYLPSPGATPNVLPLPMPSIDFAAVAWTNAPWVSGSDIAAATTGFVRTNHSGNITIRGTVAEGQGTSARGINAHAEGSFTTASGNSAHAEGYDTSASGFAAHASGMYADATDQTSFVWSGGSDVGDRYASHGKRTFNLNPGGGADGFWIGEQTLSEIIDARVIAATNALIRLINH